MNDGIIYTEYLNFTRFYMRWWLSSQDIPNNRSLISWEIGVQGTAGRTAYWYSNAVRIDSGYLDGQLVNGSNTYSNITLAGNGLRGLRSGSTWIGHNADGGKAFGISIAGWLYANGSRSVSGSWNLPTIPRNSQVTTNDSGAYDLGTPLTIYTNRKSTAFSHTITIRLNNSAGAVLHTINNVGDNVTWTPTEAQITTMQNAIPNDTSLNLWIYQHNNQVNAGSETNVRTYLRNANPTYSNFTFKDSNAATVAITGSDQILVKGKSTLQVSIASADKMVANKGATPNKYAVAYDGTSNQVNYATTALTSSFSDITTIGNRTIQVTAYDSRLNTTPVSKSVTVYDYTLPTITTTLVRENNFGANTTLHIEGTYTPLVIGGTAKNALTASTLQYRYKASDTTTWGTWTTRAFTANTTAGTYTITDFVISLDNQKKYDFEFHINDKFGQVTTTNFVDVGTPIVFMGQNSGQASLSIGSMPVAGAALTLNGVAVNSCPYDVGDIYMTVNPNRDTAAKVAARWPGTTWVAWSVGRVPVGVDAAQSEFNAVEKTGGHKLMQAHAHGYRLNLTHSDGQVINGEYINAPLAGGTARRRYTDITDNTGGGDSQNLQPYTTAYLWKRTA